jgi:hypothetical protein
MPPVTRPYRDAIAKLGLSQERAGLWLGLSRRQGQRYATGEQKIPEPVARMLMPGIEYVSVPWPPPTSTVCDEAVTAGRRPLGYAARPNRATNSTRHDCKGVN